MKIISLTNERLEEFLDYCRKHKREVDDSFLYEEDLKAFQPNDENPTYIAISEGGRIKAVASLIMDDYARRGKKARFRIFHSEEGDIEVYQGLMSKLMEHSGGFDKYFVYVPLENKNLENHISRLNFTIERYSYILLWDDSEVQPISFPENYEVRPFRLGKDEETWCLVRNAGFATLQGSETPMTFAEVTKMMQSEDYVEGGAMILYHFDRPVGVVKCSDDEYCGIPTMHIGALAIIPEYQGKGLGRMMLRKAIQFGLDNSYKQTYLAVNGENERAKSLYLQEGFRQVEGVVCYSYYL